MYFTYADASLCKLPTLYNIHKPISQKHKQKRLKSWSLTSLEQREQRLFSKLTLIDKLFSARFISLSSNTVSSAMWPDSPEYLKHITKESSLPCAENGGNLTSRFFGYQYDQRP